MAKSKEKITSFLIFPDYLTQREGLVLTFRYGWMGYDRKTLKEIGKMLGVSSSTVWTIEQKAKIKVSMGLNDGKK